MDILNEIIKIIGNLRESKHKLIIFFLMAISGIIYVWTEDYNNWFKWSVIITIVVVYIILWFDTKNYNSLPRNKDKDKNAILIRIFAKDKNEYEDIKFKFGTEFSTFLKPEDNNLNVIYIQHHLVDKHNYESKDKIIKLLEKTESIFLITIKARSENVKENVKYITEFNLGIIHPEYKEFIDKYVKYQFNTLTKPMSRIEYTAEDKLSVLEVSAQRISLVCKYFISQAYFFVNELDNAINIAQRLYDELKSCKNDKMFELVNKLCYNIYISKALKDNITLENAKKVEEELKLANKYVQNTYLFFEGMSVCCFLLYRDIKKTKDYIGNCKKIASKAPWKYSDAFLKAYCNESEGKVFYHYKQAFNIPYPYSSLISFIGEILDVEPEKNMLRFAITLLSLEMGDIKLAHKYMREYLENKENNRLDSNIEEQLSKKFGKEIIEDILN